MTHRKLFAVLLVLLPLSALAGVSFMAVGRTGGQDAEMRVRAVVSGPRIKVSILSSADPSFAPGSYMLSTDGGKTMFMVSPLTRTYVRYDSQEMLSTMGQMARGMRGSMRVSFESPKVEKLLEKDGGKIAGLPTRHYRYRTSYAMTLQVSGAKRLETTIEEDIWATTELRDPGLAVWLKRPPATTGDAQIDSMIRAEMEKVQGFPLKRVRKSTSVDAEGVAHSEQNEMEVTEVKEQAVPPGDFVIPRSYHEVKPLAPQD